MTAYTCPVCEDVGPEPCVDVVELATDAVLVDYEGSSPLLSSLLESGEDPAVAVPLLVAHPGWSAVFAEARAHGEACNIVECSVSLIAECVLQIDAWFWQTREAALA